jgi:hypothetical protein
MEFLRDNCKLFAHTGGMLNFSCGDKDLDDFFLYDANGFKALFSSDEQEREYIGLPPEKELSTRLMYYDLMLT